jgi:hypothetical protein
MNSDTGSSVSRRRSLFVWGLFCALAGAIFLAYVFASLAAGRGELVMPLDDVYIHFQYARQIAVGQPYIYNPGGPPSSGATSFLYPYLLAIGYWLGFQGLNLGLWALGLGAVALVGATELVYRLARTFAAPEWLAILVAVTFEIIGPVAWHFMSGMETGLMVLFTLATLYLLMPRPDPTYRFGGFALVAALLALIRPEGGILVLLAVSLKVIQTRQDQVRMQGGSTVRKQTYLGLLIPILALGVQPLVNLMLTGSAVASGNAAKSVFGIVPFYWDEVARRITENFARMWLEFFSGVSPHEGLYLLPLFSLLAIGGWLALLAKRERRWLGIMLLGWLLFGTLAIATLETAFWHFKRYQMPFIALLFPLAAWGITQLVSMRRRVLASRLVQWATAGVLGLALAVSLWTGAQFLRYYALNVTYVYLQPLQMARWLRANTQPDAVIAVHDTGLLRYVGGRTTIDMVGLTTPGAADYWRNGPGAVAEYLMQQRPDIIASYGPGHGFGLGLIADTSIYGKPLVSFPIKLDDNANVALAADFQGIYQPRWSELAWMRNRGRPLQPYSLEVGRTESSVMDSLNVANLIDERGHSYRWRNSERLPGFPTEVHEFDYVRCATDNCRLADGGRLINGEEAFDLAWGSYSTPSDVILVTRLHPAYLGTFDVYVNDEFVATRWIPVIPGQWLEIATRIPAEIVAKTTTNTLHVRIIPRVQHGFYMPYYHWLYAASQVDARPTPNPVATFQSSAIVLAKTALEYQPGTDQLSVKLDWYSEGKAQGDYKVFVHLYRDIAQAPIAQADRYPGDGALPPGNWLPGMIHDTIMVDLKEISLGKYRVAIGLYNPYILERLMPAGGDDQGRLFIGDIEVK